MSTDVDAARTEAPESFDASAVEVFDEPARWRAEIITRFRLRGAERCAAASPCPGFPQILDSTVRALGSTPPGPWLDVGGGLGGVASWIERTLGRTVVCLDPAFGSLRAASRLFPTVPVAMATGQHLPVRDRSIPVVLLCGVASLLDRLDGLLAEVRRVLLADGSVLVTDLWSSTPESFRSEPNTFWSVERFVSIAGQQGLVHRHVAVADMSLGWWSDAATQVDDEIHERYADREGYESWRRDAAHLRDVIDGGHVLPAGLVLSAG